MRQQSLVLSFVLLLVFLHVSVEASAGIITITTATGHGGDATVKKPKNSGPALNYGATEVIEVHRPGNAIQPTEHTKKGYLRFDLSALADGNYDFVSLNLNFQPVTTDIDPIRSFNLYGLLDVADPAYSGGDAAEDWAEGSSVFGQQPSENEITWQSAPANNVNDAAGFLPGAVLLGTLTIDVAGMVHITDSLLCGGIGLTPFIAGDTNNLITLMISANGGDWSSPTSSKITSSEGASAFHPSISFQESMPTTTPQLSPEPASLLIWGVLSLGTLPLARNRRRLFGQ